MFLLSAALKYSGFTDAYRTPFPSLSLFLARGDTAQLGGGKKLWTWLLNVILLRTSTPYYHRAMLMKTSH